MNKKQKRTNQSNKASVEKKSSISLIKNMKLMQMRVEIYRGWY